MGWLRPVNILARDLPDAWYQAVQYVLEYGRQWTVQRGSYEGQKRWEADWVDIQITHPGVRPIIPDMPPHLSNVPPPTTMEYIDEYLPYLMTLSTPQAPSFRAGRMSTCLGYSEAKNWRRLMVHLQPYL